MCPDPPFISTLIDSSIAGFAVLGGIMVTASGFWASVVFWPARRLRFVADAINVGIVLGFAIGSLPAATAFILSLTAR